MSYQTKYNWHRLSTETTYNAGNFKVTERSKRRRKADHVSTGRGKSGKLAHIESKRQAAEDNLHRNARAYDKAQRARCQREERRAKRK